MLRLFSYLQNEQVDMASNANESMSEGYKSSPTSDVVEDDGILSYLKFYVHFSCSL